MNPKLINKTFRLEPKNHQKPTKIESYDVNISAKEYLEKQRQEARRLKDKRISFTDNNKSRKAASLTIIKEPQEQ